MRRLYATCVRISSLAAAGSLHVAMTLALIGLLSATSPAGETWDGGGSNSEWSTGANWNTVRGSETPPPNDGTADIIMAGTTKLSNQLDVDWDINSLTFNNTAGAFSINGFSGVTLAIGAGGMSNNDTQVQTLLLPIGLNASQTWTAGAGPIVLASGISSHPLLPRTLTLAGGFDITVAGAITNNTTLNKTGAGTLFLVGSDANTYAGSTNVTGGTLALNRTGGTDRAIPGNLVIGDGAGIDTVRLDAAEQITSAAGKIVTLNTSGVFNLNGFNETIRDLTINGGSVTTGGGTLTVAGSLSTTGGSVMTSGGALTVAGSLSTTGGTLQLLTNASVTSGSGSIGDPAGSNGQVAVSGTAATWTNSAELYVGNAGDGTLDIAADGDVSNAAGYIGNQANSTGTATVNGTGSTWTNSGNLYVGNAGSGTLDITSGGQITNAIGYIGDDTGSIGEVTVSDSYSRWTNTADLYVGNLGTGTLTIASSGRVYDENAYVAYSGGTSGEVNVENGAWFTDRNLYVGHSGGGVLNVLAGGIVSVGDFSSITELSIVEIGYRNGAIGQVLVDGSGLGGSSRLTIDGHLSIGEQGEGTLDVTNGAIVEALSAYIGGPNSSVTVDGPASLFRLMVVDVSRMFDPPDGTLQVGGTLRITNGGTVQTALPTFGGASVGDVVNWIDADAASTGLVTVDNGSWHLVNELSVGANGHGTLEIVNGGIVTKDVTSDSAFAGFIARNAGSTGTLLVDGLGSTWSGDELSIGYEGTGTLNITAGGIVSSTLGVIGQLNLGVGIVTVTGNGSTWTNSHALEIGRFGSGLLTVSNGGEVEANTVSVRSLGELHGNGNIIADVENGGLISPGTFLGTLHIDGNYVQRTNEFQVYYGELHIELASPTTFDQLLITGEAILDGTLTVDLLGGFTPSVGQSFTILTADFVAGTFATETLPSVPGLAFDVIYNPASVVLMVLAAGVPGDYNDDGTVDAGDYVVWRKTDGTPAGYNTWRTHFGQTGGGGSGAIANAAVPEPSTLAMLLVGMLAAYARRRALVS